MRKLLAKILSRIARFTWTTVEVVVDGVKRVVSLLLPSRPTPFEDVADEIVAEHASTPDPARERAHLERCLGSEAERVRKAAKELTEGRRVPASWLDPNDKRGAQLLTWLGGLDDFQRSMIVRASEEDLDLHLSGIPSLRMPLLPVDQAALDAKAERKRPPEFHDWVRILSAERAQEQGDADHRDVDEIVEEARRLVEARVTLDEWKPPSREKTPAGFSDDDE